MTGGNMVNLMALWREHGLDRSCSTAHERGILLCGYSAGSMCWFEWGVSRGVGKPVADRGLGLLARQPLRALLAGSGAPRRLPGAASGGGIARGLALDDHAAALFRDGVLVEAVRSKRERAGIPRRAGHRRASASSRCRPGWSSQSGAAPLEPALEEMRAIRRMRGGPGRTVRHR